MKKIESILLSPKYISIIETIKKLFIKLPHLPKKISKLLIIIIPWLILVGGIFWATYAVSESLLWLISLFAFDPVESGLKVIDILIAVLSAYLMIIAFKPLKKKLIEGWVYLFWATALSSTVSVFELYGSSQSILNIILIIIFSFYLVFEIEEFYMAENNG